ncbi:hypothetical protein PgNI_05841 [Pyricularia grisea]|uniref:Uncharacterized protein n=1 Tax=Pyricularia grisea TaxID=148305 RepID=A0A6P8B589_PYRGI|nr:hypothetical protein PgNI_05841 [Pyricularia grisea]TLD10506.1 hypothetical protein PgNI_05841 [Pyricularia grisea]
MDTPRQRPRYEGSETIDIGDWPCLRRSQAVQLPRLLQAATKATYPHDADQQTGLATTSFAYSLLLNPAKSSHTGILADRLRKANRRTFSHSRKGPRGD